MVQLLAEEGDIVRAGQVLARIDPDRARMEMERARANMSKLENNFRRSKELLAQKLRVLLMPLSTQSEMVEQMREFLNPQYHTG